MSVQPTIKIERPAVSVRSGAIVRLSDNERRLLCLAIESAIQNQTNLIDANHDRYTREPCEGADEFIKEWRKGGRAWKALREKLQPNVKDEPRR